MKTKYRVYDDLETYVATCVNLYDALDLAYKYGGFVVGTDGGRHYPEGKVTT